MKYIIMCGGDDRPTPKHLSIVNGETVVARTIRLLRENNVTDIAISSNNPVFETLGVPVLHHKNTGSWLNAYYPTNEPVCYIYGDVVFSEKAINKIVKTQTDSIEYFASSPPFSRYYTKIWAEPFAFKVADQKLFKKAIKKTKENHKKGLFNREPISWELWQVIKETPLNEIDYKNYTIINDFTCDVDEPSDLDKIQKAMVRAEGNI